MQTRLNNPASDFLAKRQDLVQKARVLGGAEPPFVLLLVDRRGASLFPDVFSGAGRIDASCAVISLSGLLSRLDQPGAETVRHQLNTHVPGPLAPTLVAARGAFYFADGGQRGQA